MIKPEDQLNDSGAVIGYKPNLEYKKNIDGESKLYKNSNSKKNKQEENYYDENGNLVVPDEHNPRKYVLSENINNEFTQLAPFSKTLKSFIKNSPGKTIDNLISTSKFISDIITRLSDEFNNNQDNDTKYDKLCNIEGLINGINSGDKDYVDNFVNKYKNDIKLSQIPEMIYHLQNLVNDIDKTMSYLKKLYYGDVNIEPNKYKMADDDLIDRLKAQEKTAKSNNNFPNINYLTVGIDSLLNTGINIYCSKLKDKVATFEQVAYVQDDTGIKNQIMIPMVKRMFDEINEELEARQITYDAQYDVDTKEKALYNYYEARSNLRDLYNAISESVSETNFLLKHVQDYEDALTDAIDNVNRALLYDIHNTEELTRLYKEKQYMRSMDSNLSIIQ